MKTACALLLITIASASAAADQETHWNLQAVDEMGVMTWDGTLPVTITGVILNNPEEMLDATPNFIPYTPDNLMMLGGEWQIFVQAADVADHAGTALWMGQNYGNLPLRRNTAFSYTDEEWIAEMNRLNYDNGDPQTGHHFRKGDLVQVSAENVGFYGGKTNVLEMVMNVNDSDPDTHEDIFDPTRQTGGEYYQARLVRLREVVISSGAWQPDGMLTLTDGAERYLPCRLGLSEEFSGNPAPPGAFDVVGIFNQESGSGSDGTFGYQLWVTALSDIDPYPPGDANCDRQVNGSDYTIWADHYDTSEQNWWAGDFNGDGEVDGCDYTLWADNYAPAGAQAVPCPGGLAFLSAGCLALAKRKGARTSTGGRMLS